MNSLSETIPEIFYDLLARITPGFIMILIIWPLNEEFINQLIKLNAAVYGTSLFMMSYIIGFIFQQLSSSFFGLLFWPHFNKLLSRYFQSDLWSINPIHVMDSLSEGKEKQILVKMLAEKTLLEVLFIMSLFVSLILKPDFIDQIHYSHRWGISIVLFLLCCAMNYFLQDRSHTFLKISLTNGST